MEDVLRQYEDSFFSKEFCEDETRVSKRIHDDYMGYSVRGETLNKVKLISFLTNLNKDQPIEISKFTSEVLSDDVQLVHYETTYGDTGKVFLCSSIWKLADGDWKLYFHQGTRLMED